MEDLNLLISLSWEFPQSGLTTRTLVISVARLSSLPNA